MLGEKTMMRGGWGILASLLVLSGCVSPQKVQKTRDDAAAYTAARHERDVAQHCIDPGAMPGTEADLECRLGLSKPPQASPVH